MENVKLGTRGRQRKESFTRFPSDFLFENVVIRRRKLLVRILNKHFSFFRPLKYDLSAYELEYTMGSYFMINTFSITLIFVTIWEIS